MNPKEAAHLDGHLEKPVIAVQPSLETRGATLVVARSAHRVALAGGD